MSATWDWAGSPPEPRRLRQIYVSPELLAQLFGTGTSESVNDEQVPDLRILAVRVNDWAGRFEFLVTSETFEEVHESEEIPVWNPAYRRVFHEEAVPA